MWIVFVLLMLYNLEKYNVYVIKHMNCFVDSGNSRNFDASNKCSFYTYCFRVVPGMIKIRI